MAEVAGVVAGVAEVAAEVAGVAVGAVGAVGEVGGVVVGDLVQVALVELGGDESLYSAQT